MKKIISLITIVLTIIACSGGQAPKSLKGTTWVGVGRDSDKQIVFNDSTCIIGDASKATGHITYMEAYYKVSNDTISFVPMDEFVQIGSKLVITDDGLMEAKHGVIVFKYKEQ